MNNCQNCESCQWDVKAEKSGLRMTQCGQGHTRSFLETIENCHAWKEKKEECCLLKFYPGATWPIDAPDMQEKKEECWWCRDWSAFTRNFRTFDPFTYYKIEKLIGLSKDYPECPVCARKFKEK